MLPNLASGLAFIPAELLRQALEAALVTIVFALGAARLHSVDTSGALAGAVACFFLYFSLGPGAFLTLLAVFVIAWTTTRFRYDHKRRLGLAERAKGRNAWQILANLSIAAGFGMAAWALDRPSMVLACVAALAEAAADTACSEIGQAVGNRAYLIVHFRRVTVGTDGAISVAGTAAGVLAAVAVALVAFEARLLPPHWILAAAGAGVIGTFVDSLLGATLQRARLLSNSAVNLLSTSAAAAIGLLLASR